MVKNLPAMQETWVWPLGWEDPLEKGKVTHFSIFAWRIPWTEEPGKLQSMGLQESDMIAWLTLTFNVIFFSLFEKLTDGEVLACAVAWFHFLYAFSSLLAFKILKFMLLLGVIKSQILIHNLKKQLLEEYIENKISPLVRFYLKKIDHLKINLFFFFKKSELLLCFSLS